MLEVKALSAFQGRAQLLFDVSFEAKAGEVLVLVGRNGAGKSTTMRAIMGLMSGVTGEVRFDGAMITSLTPHEIARRGLGYVPEERRIYTDLTVAENLEVGRQPSRQNVNDAPRWTVARVCELFPKLGEMLDRPGGQMSGGEQQMLTIARTLMGNPSAVLLDEPSEGLAPVIVEQMALAVRAMKREGVAVLLSEQNLAFASSIADRALVIDKGAIVFTGAMTSFMADASLRERFLGV